jgi:hypothetical protein
VPYRNSKLTMLLSDALGAKGACAKTLMLMQVRKGAACDGNLGGGGVCLAALLLPAAPCTAGHLASAHLTQAQHNYPFRTRPPTSHNTALLACLCTPHPPSLSFLCTCRRLAPPPTSPCPL